jgi:hypothetical protein
MEDSFFSEEEENQGLNPDSLQSDTEKKDDSEKSVGDARPQTRQTDERTGLGRDKSNSDINYLIEDNHGRTHDVRNRQGLFFKEGLDNELSASPPIYNHSIYDKGDLNINQTKHNSQSLVKINPNIIEIPNQ